MRGYGQPTAGDYVPSAGGYHAFGTIGQGDSNRGLIEDISTSCQERTLDVTITAKQDQNDSVIKLEMGSYPTDKVDILSAGAIYLTMTASIMMSAAYTLI